MSCFRMFAGGLCVACALLAAGVAGCSQNEAKDETAKSPSSSAIKNIAHKPVTEDVPTQDVAAATPPVEKVPAPAAAEEKSPASPPAPQPAAVVAEKDPAGAGILAEDPLDSADPVIRVVVMSEQHAATCLIKVGDTFPNATLPDINGDRQDVAKLLGERLTIVLFWSPENRSSVVELGELAARVASPLHACGVRVVGVCEHATAETASASPRARVYRSRSCWTTTVRFSVTSRRRKCRARICWTPAARSCGSTSNTRMPCGATRERLRAPQHH